jgi:1,4-alpha-glucan branching enzyme
VADKPSAQTVQALVQGWHEAPEAVLGLHPSGDGMLRASALLPGASLVELVDTAKAQVIATLRQRDPQGYFEAHLRRKKPFDYRFRVTWADGGQGEYADAYAFGPQLDAGEVVAFGRGESIRAQDWMGAHLQQRATPGGDVAGTNFVVWAPNAQRVSVVGSFNNWDGRRHRLRRATGPGIDPFACGLWELWVPHVGQGDLYKFEIVGPDGQLQALKADPYARSAQMRPETASVVAAELPRVPSPVGRQVANSRHAPMSVYEVHLGSWRTGPNGRFLTSWRNSCPITPPTWASPTSN